MEKNNPLASGIPLPQEMAEQLWEQRLLVFLETQPQSNKFRQVIFNKEGYKALTDSIGKELSTQKTLGIRVKEINQSDMVYTLMDLQSHI